MSLLVVFDLKILERKLARLLENPKFLNREINHLIKTLKLMQNKRQTRIALLLFFGDEKRKLLWKKVVKKISKALSVKSILIETGQNRGYTIAGVLSSLLKKSETRESFLKDFSLSQKDLKRLKRAKVIAILDRKLPKLKEVGNNEIYYY